ncbi:MAG: septum site-determining protein MinC [Gammaproteobacteria bacterium]|nr:MAG: septum site-determining protein MinC [Gammaproteobacteria bacterium]
MPLANLPLRLRASRTTLTTLEILVADPPAIANLLEEQARRAPDLFRYMPVVIDVTAVEDRLAPEELTQLIQVIEEAGLRPAAIHATADSLLTAIHALHLGQISLSGERPAATESPATDGAPEPPQATPAPPTGTGIGKVVTQPVRSGQQIYAQGTDLIVLAPVSAGAEILADGHIHVYGPLRGRALAGVHGDTRARIFCTHLEAELVSIAGQYKISEDLQATQWKQPAQIRLDEEKLVVAAL